MKDRTKWIILAVILLACAWWACGCVSLTIVCNIGGTVNVIPVTKWQGGTNNTMPSSTTATQGNTNSGSATIPLGEYLPAYRMPPIYHPT